MIEHTPGPWEWGWKDDPDNPGSVVAVGPPNHPHRPYAVAMCPRYRGRDRAQHSWEADARLIAAAPDMLDMLETIENDAGQVPEWLWNRIQAVIAKAKGDNA